MKTQKTWLEANLVASLVIEQLRPYCVRIEVAGSIRRKAPEVGDIEIVAEPKMERVADLFSPTDAKFIGQDGESFGLHEAFTPLNHDLFWPGKRIVKEIADYEVERQTGQSIPKIIKQGDRYIQFFYQNNQVDLFLADAERYGLILAIRTGPDSFSRKLVSQAEGQYGYLPNDYFVDKGALWKHGKGAADTFVPTPTEEALFAVLGRPWILPEERK